MVHAATSPALSRPYLGLMQGSYPPDFSWRRRAEAVPDSLTWKYSCRIVRGACRAYTRSPSSPELPRRHRLPEPKDPAVREGRPASKRIGLAPAASPGPPKATTSPSRGHSSSLSTVTKATRAISTIVTPSRLATPAFCCCRSTALVTRDVTTPNHRAAGGGGKEATTTTPSGPHYKSTPWKKSTTSSSSRCTSSGFLAARAI